MKRNNSNGRGRPGKRNKAITRDRIINERRGAARLRVTLAEYRRRATEPDFPPHWTDLTGQPYWLVEDLDAYAKSHRLIIQCNIFGE